MVLQVGLKPVLGAFGCVLGGQATKSTALVRPKDLFVLIFSWQARFPWTKGTLCWPSPVMGDFGCVLCGQATKSTACVRPKDIFCVNFGQEGHLPTQHPGWLKKISKCKPPGTCALLEILHSPVDFFQRAKLSGHLRKFCILPTYFYKY
jgi:hypothetical protein